MDDDRKKHYHHAIRYFLFWEKRFLSPARIFGAKALLNTVAAAAATKLNVAYKAIVLKFGSEVFHWQHLFHNLSEKTYRRELQDSLQPVAKMPTEQKANINAISACCDKRGVVCNDSLGQSINRSIKCYYWSR